MAEITAKWSSNLLNGNPKNGKVDGFEAFMLTNRINGYNRETSLCKSSAKIVGIQTIFLPRFLEIISVYFTLERFKDKHSKSLE